MSEQIDLHVFKAITAASCVDNIVNKRLNKYSALQYLAPVQLLAPVLPCCNYT